MADISQVVNEGSTVRLTVQFADSNGNLESPASVTWEAYDWGSKTEIQAATSVTPGTSIEIAIPPAVNTIVNSAKKLETRVILVRATYGENDVINDEYRYTVKNLTFVP